MTTIVLEFHDGVVDRSVIMSRMTKRDDQMHKGVHRCDVCVTDDQGNWYTVTIERCEPPSGQNP